MSTKIILATSRFPMTLGLAVAIFFAPWVASYSQESPISAIESVTPTDDRIYLPIENGGIDRTKLESILAEELHWAAADLMKFKKLFQERVGSEATQVPIADVAWLIQLFPGIFEFAQRPSDQRECFAVHKNRLAETFGAAKRSVREQLATANGEPLSGMKRLGALWPSSNTTTASDSTGKAIDKSTPAFPRIIVTMCGIHGFKESSEDLAIELSKRSELPSAVFFYPNDAPIVESAERLRKELVSLHHDFPNTPITLVAHSFGGLVARQLLELPSAAGETPEETSTATGVDQLIQVCPPNHGSALSDYAPLLEAVEQWSRLTEGKQREQPALWRMIADGFNEAAGTLDPNSPELARLNRASRNASVQYTIIAGDAGPLRPGGQMILGAIWDSVAQALQGEDGQNVAPILDRRVKEVLECPELQDGQGDGVVCLQSAKLAGVSEFVVLPIHHLTWSQLDTTEGQQLVETLTKHIGISL